MKHSDLTIGNVYERVSSSVKVEPKVKLLAFTDKWSIVEFIGGKFDGEQYTYTLNHLLENFKPETKVITADVYVVWLENVDGKIVECVYDNKEKFLKDCKPEDRYDSYIRSVEKFTVSYKEGHFDI